MATAREEALKRIEKKRSEITSVEMQIREANSYIQALEDLLKMLPREPSAVAGSEAHSQTLRPGSVVARAREAILKAGRPLRITEILAALEKPTDNTTRAGVSGSISAYYRKGEVFTRPAPNTFGLIEIGNKLDTQRARGKSMDPAPPPNFGLDLEEDDFAEDETAEDARMKA